MREVAIIGGGIVGLATAYKLQRRDPRLRVTVFEKESDVGRHQSTHNSGVLHSGLHYKPGSLKARLAVRGIREMTAFCIQRGIKTERCGKLVVATNDLERERLRELHRRGSENGLHGLRWLEREEMRELEPHVGGSWALHVPEEGIVDYGAVCAALAGEIRANGGEVRTGEAVRFIERDATAGPSLRSGRQGWRINDRPFDLLVNCGGLYADRIARLAGLRVENQVLPFRGEYWVLRPERRHLVRNLIYPVPDPTFPFLGVHFTRTVFGEIEAGPNAVLALAREGYRWSNVNGRDLLEALGYRGLWRFLAKYPRVATYEIARSISRRLFVESLRRLVPDLRLDDLVRGPSGVRAQLVSPAGDLVQDFDIARAPAAIHVLGAPSPAATASLAIGGYVAGMVLESVS